MYTGECDYNKCNEIEKFILNKYGFIRRFVIGKTVLGRMIRAYTIGQGGGVVLCGAFHGMERITAMMLYMFLEEVCEKYECDTKFKKLLQGSGITIVPMMNPDGAEISIHGIKTAKMRAEFVSECLVWAGLPHTKWQANSNGVDLNHNFDAGFKAVKENERKMGIYNPYPTRFGGDYPESERETKALCELCRQNKYKIAAALHTQGEEIYYDYGEHTPKESFSIAQRLSELSGYTVSKPTGIAVGGGFKDWFIEEFHRPAFTFEIGKGVNPLSPDVLGSEYPFVSKMLWYLLEYAIKNSDE